MMPGLHNDLIDPAEMMIRAFHLWQQTRWPGRNGRGRYAHTLFNVYVLRFLELLSMRVWDSGSSGAGERLAQAQRVLDELWKGTPADQPVLVRDARWLIPLAQSPTTDDLSAYFEVSERIAESFSEQDRIEIRKASVCMIGGHLRSQIRHYCTTDGVSVDERSVVLRTRTSNALDLALLIQGLVPLLEAYERACESGDGSKRRELAGVFCQGISPDPELFLNRLDVLGAYSMIEHLFVTADGEERADYTPMGRRHVRLIQEYETLVNRLAQPLYDDCPHFKPLAGVYSPYGAIYGTPSNLTEHMALKAIQPDAVARFSLEDVFSEGEADAAKLAWADGWRKLPHIEPEVRSLFDYPQQFAEDIFDRIERALRIRASEVGTAKGRGSDAAGTAVRTGRLCILIGDGLQAESGMAPIAELPDLPTRYIRSSDPEIVAARKAEPSDEAQLLRDRQEGMFVVSFATPGGWVAITKDVLTEVLAAGRDVKVVGLPRAAAQVLALMCPNLAACNGH
jgi:hypothetical protein